MSIEAITALWEAKAAEAVAKRHEAELIEAEARGLWTALETLRAAAQPSSDKESASADSGRIRGFSSHYTLSPKRPRAGRQPGSISNKWKRNLLQLRELGEVFSVEDVVRFISEHEGRLMKPSEVQRLFGKFSMYGYVKFFDDGLFVVPEEAARKFQATIGSDVDITEEEGEEGDDIESAEDQNIDVDPLADRHSH